MDSVPVETNIPTLQPRVTKFVSGLPNPETANLRDEQKSCHICMEPFTGGLLQELPVLLPCGHIFGKDCMIKWLSSDGDRSPRNCPMCRAKLFPQSPSSNSEYWSGPVGDDTRMRRPISRMADWGNMYLPGEIGEANHLMRPLAVTVHEEDSGLAMRPSFGLAAYGNTRPPFGERMAEMTTERPPVG